jgi:RNA polymerase sigma factor (sigma-70 family)
VLASGQDASMSDRPPDPSRSSARTTDREDAALLERLRSNDREAMSELYDACGRQAFGLAYRIVGEAAEAEDVVQEAFLTLWRQAARLDAARGSVRSLLLTIVHRRAVDAVRLRAGRPERGLEAIERVLAAPDDPFESASLAEERSRVRRALDELPPDQREAIEQTYFGGLTVAELAGRAGVPLGTAKSRLRLALQRMRKSLTV